MQRKFFCTLFLSLLAGTSIIAADKAPLPFVSPMFGDNMVFQREKANIVWGWSTPGQGVRVEIGGHTAKTVTGADGRWQVRIMPPAAGGPYTLKIDGPQSVEFHEVLVGDVWLCGGQSNMELGLARARNGTNEIKLANHPEIRLFKVASHISYSPAQVPSGKWRICSPESMAADGGFSAVGYFFGRRIQQDIHVPVGLVEDCLGGTPAEEWTSPETLRGLKDFDAQLDELARLKARGGPEYGNYVMHWYDDYDIGLKGNWAAVDFDDSSWKTVQISGGFAELGVPDTIAVCWFRKQIILPDPLPAGKAVIKLGVVGRMDTTYINGQWVGASAWSENPRVYSLKDGILQPGTNLVTVRVLKTKPDGGFMAKPDGLVLMLGDGTKVPLAGEWKGALSVDARPPHPLPMGFENWPVIPSVLYQGMLEPAAPLTVTGAIWYQGEANADRAYQYRTVLPAMISDWRKLFGQGDFPFYIVSLPAFMHHQDEPVESAWAELREAQALTARNVENSGLAVTIDTGEPDNIHPAEKEIVGERLALVALARRYGEKIPCEGPTFASLSHLHGALELHFEHTDGGLVVKGEQPGEFAIAGKDHKWYRADAKIQGDAIVVSSPQVPEPVAARYAWQSFPVANVYNGAGLPAVPFRTDDWPGITGGVKP